MNQGSGNKNQSQTNEIMHKPIVYFFTILTLMVVFTSCKDKATCSQDAVNRDSIDSDSLFIDSIICDLQNDTLLTGIDLENAKFYLYKDTTKTLGYLERLDNPNCQLYDYFDFTKGQYVIYSLIDGKCQNKICNERDREVAAVLRKYCYTGTLLCYKSLPLAHEPRRTLKQNFKVDLWVVLYKNFSYVIKCTRI